MNGEWKKRSKKRNDERAGKVLHEVNESVISEYLVKFSRVRKRRLIEVNCR